MFETHLGANAWVAQLVEHPLYHWKVPGSIPILAMSENNAYQFLLIGRQFESCTRDGGAWKDDGFANDCLKIVVHAMLSWYMHRP